MISLKRVRKKKLGNVYLYIMLIFFLLHFSTTQRLGNFRCVFLWTNTTFKGTYLCSRLISSTAVKHLSDVKAILI